MDNNQNNVVTADFTPKTAKELAEFIETLDDQITAADYAGVDCKDLVERKRRANQRLTNMKKRLEADEEKDEANMVIRARLSKFIETHNIHFDTTNVKYWWQSENGRWHFSPVQGMRGMLPDNVPHNQTTMGELSAILSGMKRVITGTTYDIGKPEAGVLNLLNPEILHPAERPDDPSAFFRKLMVSIATTEEAADYVEKWICARYTLAVKGKNSFFLPTLVIGDEGGGSGKGILCESILPQIFGENCVAGNLAIGDFTGRFNSSTEGQIIVAINEVDHENTNINSLKAILGSAKIRLEAKGLATRHIPNIGAYIMTGNKAHEVVRLKGDSLGIDRRFSIIVSKGRRLKHWVADDLGLSAAEDVEDAVTKIRETIWDDAGQVSLWLRHILDKHGCIESLPPYHGQEYRDTVSRQLKLHERFFVAAFGEYFTSVPAIIVNEAYQLLCEEEGERPQYRLKRSSLYNALETWLAKHRPDIAIVNDRSPRSNNNTRWYIATENDVEAFVEKEWIMNDCLSKRLAFDID